MKVLQSLLVITLLFVFISCKEDSSSPNTITGIGTIKGSVISADSSKKLENVMIQTFPASEVILSGSDGKFELSDINQGNYTIKFSKYGYYDLNVSVAVQNGKTTIVNVQLYPLTMQLGSNYDTLNDNYDKPVMYLPFDNDVNDYSNNHLTTFSNNTQFTTDRHNNPGKAICFNGLDSYVRIPYTSILNLNNNFSISLWFKPDLHGGKVDDLYGGIAVLGRWDKYGYGESSYGMSHGINGDLWFGTHDGNGVGTGVLANIGSLTDNQWQHIVFVKSASKGDIFLNTNLIASNDYLQNPQFSNYDFYIGKLNYDWSFFKGAIDDLYVYDKALSTEEINQLYNS
jgi:hypothetical protein